MKVNYSVNGESNSIEFNLTPPSGIEPTNVIEKPMLIKLEPTEENPKERYKLIGVLSGVVYNDAYKESSSRITVAGLTGAGQYWINYNGGSVQNSTRLLNKHFGEANIESFEVVKEQHDILIDNYQESDCAFTPPFMDESKGAIKSCSSIIVTLKQRCISSTFFIDLIHGKLPFNKIRFEREGRSLETVVFGTGNDSITAFAELFEDKVTGEVYMASSYGLDSNYKPDTSGKSRIHFSGVNLGSDKSQSVVIGGKDVLIKDSMRYQTHEGFKTVENFHDVAGINFKIYPADPGNPTDPLDAYSYFKNQTGSPDISFISCSGFTTKAPVSDPIPIQPTYFGSDNVETGMVLKYRVNEGEWQYAFSESAAGYNGYNILEQIKDPKGNLLISRGSTTSFIIESDTRLLRPVTRDILPPYTYVEKMSVKVEFVAIDYEDPEEHWRDIVDSNPGANDIYYSDAHTTLFGWDAEEITVISSELRTDFFKRELGSFFLLKPDYMSLLGNINYLLFTPDYYTGEDSRWGDGIGVAFTGKNGEGLSPEDFDHSVYSDMLRDGSVTTRVPRKMQNALRKNLRFGGNSGNSVSGLVALDFTKGVAFKAETLGDQSPRMETLRCEIGARKRLAFTPGDNTGLSGYYSTSDGFSYGNFIYRSVPSQLVNLLDLILPPTDAAYLEHPLYQAGYTPIEWDSENNRYYMTINSKVDF